MCLAQEHDVVYPSDEVASVCVPSTRSQVLIKEAPWPRFLKVEYVAPEIDTNRIAATDELIPIGALFPTSNHTSFRNFAIPVEVRSMPRVTCSSDVFVDVTMQAPVKLSLEARAVACHLMHLNCGYMLNPRVAKTQNAGVGLARLMP
eukprot:2080435-Amphidinium_carterae.1